MRGSTGGWSIWTRSGERIRQFTVAMTSEQHAVAAMRAENPDIEVLSRYCVAPAIVDKLGMTDGDITEWVPLDCKERRVTASAPIAG